MVLAQLPDFSCLIVRHLAPVSLQVSVLALLALLAERLFRNAPPSFRYWLWMIVLVRLALPFSIPVSLPVAESLVTRSIPDFSYEVPQMDIPALQPEIYPAPELVKPVIPPDPFRIAGIIWLAGFSLCMLILVVRWAHTRRILAETEPLDYASLRDYVDRLTKTLGIRRRVRLYFSRSDRFHAPSVIGVFHPRIVLPWELTVWTPEEMETVLIHELVHIRRHDLAVNWGQILLQAVYFFHPFVWLANARIRAAREEMCDDRAISISGMERERYSLSLIRVGEELMRHQQFSCAEIGFFERKSHLGERVRRIMHNAYNPHKRLSTGALLVLCAAMILGTAMACDRTAVRKPPLMESARPNPANILLAAVPDESTAGINSALVPAKAESTEAPHPNEDEWLKINALDDSTFELDGVRVSRATYAQVVRKALPGHGYHYVLSASPDVSVQTLEYIRRTAAGAGASGSHDTPDVQERLMKGKVIKRFMTVVIVDDSTFETMGRRLGRTNLEQALRDSIEAHNFHVIVIQKGSTSREVVNFVDRTARSAGAKSVNIGIRHEQPGKISLVLGIVDKALFKIDGRHWVARKDLETVLRIQLPERGYSLTIYDKVGTKSAPKDVIRFVEQTAKRAGAKTITVSSSEIDYSFVNVMILDDATFVVNDVRVSRAHLDATLRDLVPRKKYNVTIDGYPDTPVETIQFVVDTAKKNGATARFSPSINHYLFGSQGSPSTP